MKQKVGLLVLVAALGVWSGVQALWGGVQGWWGGVQGWYSPPFWMKIQAAAAILSGVNLLFMAWFWSRARPGSGEALFFPGIILPSVALLVNLAPSLLWPNQEALGISASAVSIVLATIAVIFVLRANRRLWAA